MGWRARALLRDLRAAYSGQEAIALSVCALQSGLMDTWGRRTVYICASNTFLGACVGQQRFYQWPVPSDYALLPQTVSQDEQTLMSSPDQHYYNEI